MELVFATNNKNKLYEAARILPEEILVLNLDDIGHNEDIPETEKTIEGNALLKARYIYERYGENCFADDTGLLVNELNGEPGVYSARYAGEEANAGKNIEKLLKNLSGKTNRAAHFKTIIALIIKGREYTFEGIIKGTISNEPKGSSGFGYDPVFIPEGHELSFAEMSISEKNAMSHRAIALNKMADFLKSFKG